MRGQDFEVDFQAERRFHLQKPQQCLSYSSVSLTWFLQLTTRGQCILAQETYPIKELP